MIGEKMSNNTKWRPHFCVTLRNVALYPPSPAVSLRVLEVTELPLNTRWVPERG